MFQYFLCSLIVLSCITCAHAMEQEGQSPNHERKMKLTEFKKVLDERKSTIDAMVNPTEPHATPSIFKEVQRIYFTKLTPTRKLEGITNSREELKDTKEIEVQ